MTEPSNGISVERPPRPHPGSVAAGAGLLWGAFCYSVLWEGTPVEVDRAFVESVGGTLILLPARIVLWAIHALEVVAGRTFELAGSTWIFAVATCAVGLALGVLAVLAVRGALVLVRH